MEIVEKRISTLKDKSIEIIESEKIQKKALEKMSSVTVTCWTLGNLTVIEVPLNERERERWGGCGCEENKHNQSKEEKLCTTEFKARKW